MDKQKNVMFGTALNGYKRQDVNTFIAGLNRSFNEEKDKYSREITSLKAELAELRQILADREAELTTLRAAQTIVEAPQPVSTAPDIDPDELTELRKKAALYERMSGQLGDMMITANHNADLLMDETRRTAEQSLSAAKSTIAQSATLLAGQLDSLYRSANNRTMGEINAVMQQTRRSLNQFIEELSTCRTRIEETIRQTDLETRRTADEHIARMTECAQDAITAIGAKPAEDDTAK